MPCLICPPTDFFVLGVLRPSVCGPLVLDLHNILVTGIGELLLVLPGRPQAGTEIVGCLDKQSAPLFECAVVLEAAVIRNHWAHDIADLEVAARVKVSERASALAIAGSSNKLTHRPDRGAEASF